MQKLFGALLILAGCLGYGYSYIEREKQRIVYAGMWENIMLMFLEEISFKKQSLALAAFEIGQRIGGREGECFIRIYDKVINQRQNGFADIWLGEWKAYYQKRNLSVEEKKRIEEFADIIGFYDEKVQVKMIEELQNKWQNIRLDLIEEQRERKKMVWTLSACSGVMLILILI